MQHSKSWRRTKAHRFGGNLGEGQLQATNVSCAIRLLKQWRVVPWLRDGRGTNPQKRSTQNCTLTVHPHNLRGPRVTPPRHGAAAPQRLDGVRTRRRITEMVACALSQAGHQRRARAMAGVRARARCLHVVGVTDARRRLPMSGTTVSMVDSRPSRSCMQAEAAGTWGGGRSQRARGPRQRGWGTNGMHQGRMQPVAAGLLMAAPRAPLAVQQRCEHKW